MNHGQNFNRLRGHLAKAVNRIPYNRRDGLLARGRIRGPADEERHDGQGGEVPVKSALQRALNDVHDFVQGEARRGRIVVR